MAHTIYDQPTTHVHQITVTNGDKFVSIGTRTNAANNNLHFETSGFALNADKAVEFAIAILNAAANIREDKHGNGSEAVYDDRARAHKSLNWEPPVLIPGELITQLSRSKSRTDGDRRAAIAAVVKAAGR